MYRRSLERPVRTARYARAAPVLMLLLSTACYSWQAADRARFAGEDRPDRGRVVLTDGSAHVLWEPRIIPADSVFGYAEPDSAAAAWPMSEVQVLQIREINSLLTIGVTVGAMAVGFALACSSAGCTPW